MEARVPDIVKEFTRGEALLTLSFWVFSIGVATHSLLITAITFHIASMGEEMLMNRDESFAVFMPMSYFAVVSNLGSGWLSDRIHLKWLLLAFFATQAASIAGLLHLGEPSGKWLFIVAGGFSGGFFGTLVTVTWPRYFGRKHLGAITGANMSIMVAASALGPVLFAWMREWTGSFKTVVHLSWFMPITLMALGMWVENPQDKIRREADAS
jgi:MFS family permease